MTRKSISLVLLLVVLAMASVNALVQSAQVDTSLDAFRNQFKAAVIKGDKNAVAQLSKFPIGMSYGVSSVKTRAQLIKRYRQVFNGETDAAKCFAEARPVIDSGNRKRATVGCKNAAGDEVIVYGFILTRTGWKFESLDNINE